MRLAWLACLLAFLFAWFADLGGRPLLAPDEARYGEMALHIHATGDWVTPRLNGLKYFEKPPLHMWATAVAFHVYGVGETAARFWPALCGLVAVLATMVAGARLRDRATGIAAGAILASSLLWFGASHYVTLDASVSAFLAVSVFALAIGLGDATDERTRTRAMVAAWAAAALAVMSKGLIGIVLPAAAVVLHAVLTRSPHLLKRLRPGLGLAAFLALTAPWFVAVSLANPEFPHFFFVQEHLQRFAAKGHNRAGAWWYYVPVIVVGLTPWLPLVLGGIRAARRADAPIDGAARAAGGWWSGSPFRPMRFLLTWIAVVLLFFSVSRSKLPPYVLPVFPALALVAACALRDASRRWLDACAVLALVLGLAGLAAVALDLPMALASRASPETVRAATTPLTGVAVTFALAGAFALLARRFTPAGARETAAGVLAIGGLVAMHLVAEVQEAIGPALSSRSVIVAARDRIGADTPVFAFRHFDQSEAFYLRRPVTLVEVFGEVAPGALREPHRVVHSEARFVERWNALPAAAAILLPADFERLRSAGLPMQVVAADGRRVVVTKP